MGCIFPLKIGSPMFLVRIFIGRQGYCLPANNELYQGALFDAGTGGKQDSGPMGCRLILLKISFKI